MASNGVKKSSLKKLHYFRDLRIKTLQHAEGIPMKEVQLEVPLLRAVVEDIERTIQCVEGDLPFIVSCWANAPEVCAAMDINWLSIGYAHVGVDYDAFIQDLERGDQMAIPADVCTVNRQIIRSIEEGEVPIPTACVALLEPCDGLTLAHNVAMRHKDWANVPFFAPDPPYVETDPRTMPYFADELKRMVRFLEKHLGKRLDLDRLREIIEESNKQVQMFIEFNDLKRAVPCPVPSFAGASILSAATSVPAMVGLPMGTDYIRAKLAHAEEMVKAKKGAVPNEKIRVYWLDLPPAWGLMGLGMWLAQEWGANVVQDFISDCPLTLIDASTEDSMFQGLAKRDMVDNSMVRQSRGRVNLMLDDLVRIVKDFKIDCVIQARHMGHKDHSANVGLVKETCRDLGVPLLQFPLDIVDPRYTSLEEVKEKISRFFTTMELG